VTTVQNWVDRARQYLQSGLTVERNQLAAPYVAGSGTLTFKYALGGITKGARLSIGLNTFYVWDVTPSTLQATVTAAESGSVDVNVASGATVHVRPLFPDFDVFTALNEEVQALSSPQSGLFQVKTVDLTYNSAIDGYDISATDIQAIYEVRFQEPGPYKDWPRVPSHEWVLQRKAYTPDFPSGTALRLNRGGWPGYDVRVTYVAPYSSFTNLTDDVTAVCGVSAQAADIPPIGAAVRLIAGREVKRNFTETQPDTRRLEEVPPGAVANSSRGLMMLRQQRISEEAARLRAQYPYSMSI
jgi:hypothetical protein